MTARAASAVRPPPLASRAGGAARDRVVAIGSLVVLSAIGAELLAAYNDTTGQPPELLFNAAFFAMLYGCPALLIRELARRTGAHGRDWGLTHAAAVATGVLLSRGALAFLYYPVVGETSAGQKYAHNVVMLLIVAVAGAYAIRRARGSRSAGS